MHGLNALVDELNQLVTAQQSTPGEVPQHMFRDNGRLEVLRVVAVVMALCGGTLMIVAATGQSNAHNPDGLSSFERVAFTVAGALILALAIYGYRAASRTYVLVGPQGVEVHNGPRTTSIPARKVDNFVAGKSNGRGMVGVAVECLDGRKVQIAALGRFSEERLTQIINELAAALGRGEDTAIWSQGRREC